MCKSLTNYFPRNNDFLVTYFGKTQILIHESTHETSFRPVLFDFCNCLSRAATFRKFSFSCFSNKCI